jgi:hypothetical protein
MYRCITTGSDRHSSGVGGGYCEDKEINNGKDRLTVVYVKENSAYHKYFSVPISSFSSGTNIRHGSNQLQAVPQLQ